MSVEIHHSARGSRRIQIRTLDLSTTQVLARRQPIVKLAIVSSAFLCMSACVISRTGTATDHPGAMGR